MMKISKSQWRRMREAGIFIWGTLARDSLGGTCLLKRIPVGLLGPPHGLRDCRHAAVPPKKSTSASVGLTQDRWTTDRYVYMCRTSMHVVTTSPFF